jgi:phosphatidylserine/phosphatidylglycerophosphate/cardiolipin synthase-like enzyme
MDGLNDRLERQQTFFSPVSEEAIIDTAIDLITSASTCVFVSAPFFMDGRMVEAIAANDPRVLEYGLVNTTAKGGLKTLDQRPTTRFFAPSVLTTWMGKAWDAKAFGDHKIHIKSIVVDPWSRRPKVLLGSSNFSEPSCRDNDENTLLVEGDRRLAAIVTTEFLRMFDHYRTRDVINRIAESGPAAEDLLAEDSSWSRTSFDPASRSHKFRDRLTFVGDP